MSRGTRRNGMSFARLSALRSSVCDTARQSSVLVGMSSFAATLVGVTKASSAAMIMIDFRRTSIAEPYPR
jgi:hypothetical protein